LFPADHALAKQKEGIQTIKYFYCYTDFYRSFENWRGTSSTLPVRNSYLPTCVFFQKAKRKLEGLIIGHGGLSRHTLFPRKKVSLIILSKESMNEELWGQHGLHWK